MEDRHAGAVDERHAQFLLDQGGTGPEIGVVNMEAVTHEPVEETFDVCISANDAQGREVGRLHHLAHRGRRHQPGVPRAGQVFEARRP